MSIREIILWPDETLLSKCVDVDVIIHTDDVSIMIEDLTDTMQDHNGVGLAAPQIGYNKRICVIDMEKIHDADGAKEDHRRVRNILVMINPEIIDGFGDSVSIEGCLSIPGELFHVQRARTICVKYFDERRHPITREFEGFASIAIQHEVDHLEGITIADKATLERRKEIISNRNLKNAI